MCMLYIYIYIYIYAPVRAVYIQDSSIYRPRQAGGSRHDGRRAAASGKVCDAGWTRRALDWTPLHARFDQSIHSCSSMPSEQLMSSRAEQISGEQQR
jgi:hypothetical protein